MEARQKRKSQRSCWLGLTKGSSAGRIPSPVHNLLPVGSTMPSEHSSREKNIFIPSPFFLLSSSFSFMTFSVTSDKLPGLSARQIFRRDSKRTTARIQRNRSVLFFCCRFSSLRNEFHGPAKQTIKATNFSTKYTAVAGTSCFPKAGGCSSTRSVWNFLLCSTRSQSRTKTNGFEPMHYFQIPLVSLCGFTLCSGLKLSE